MLNSLAIFRHLLIYNNLCKVCKSFACFLLWPNLYYRALYMKIDNKFRHSVTLVNQEIRRRRELVELQDNDSGEIDGSLHS